MAPILRNRPTAPVFLLGLLTGGCAEAPDNGVIHVLNSAEGTWSADEHWEAVLEVEIGSMDGSGPDLFGWPIAVGVDARGGIHVLDQQATELRSFDSTGAPTSVMGQGGEGPGEFQMPLGLAVSPEGTLWVWDPMASRYSEFEPPSGFLRSVPRTSDELMLPWRGGLHPDGRMIDWVVTAPAGLAPEGDPSDGALYPVAIDLAEGSTQVFPPLVRRPRAEPFEMPTFGLDRKGTVWVAPGREYPLYRRSLGGDTLMIVSLTGFVQPEEPEMQLLHILDDGAGHLLVVLGDGEELRGSRVDVFGEADGEYLGRVSLPRRIEGRSGASASDRAIIGITQGDLGVPAVVRVVFH